MSFVEFIDMIFARNKLAIIIIILTISGNLTVLLEYIDACFRRAWPPL